MEGSVTRIRTTHAIIKRAHYPSGDKEFPVRSFDNYFGSNHRLWCDDRRGRAECDGVNML